jgi:hypothetical protein
MNNSNIVPAQTRVNTAHRVLITLYEYSGKGYSVNLALTKSGHTATAYWGMICREMGLISHDLQYTWLASGDAAHSMDTAYAVARRWREIDAKNYTRRAEAKKLAKDNAEKQRAAVPPTITPSHPADATSGVKAWDGISVPRDVATVFCEEPHQRGVVEPCTINGVLGKKTDVPETCESALVKAIVNIVHQEISKAAISEAALEALKTENDAICTALHNANADIKGLHAEVDKYKADINSFVDLVVEQLQAKNSAITAIPIAPRGIENIHKKDEKTRIMVFGLKGDQPARVNEKIRDVANVDVSYTESGACGKINGCNKIDGVITCPKWLGHAEFNHVKDIGVPLVTAWGITDVVAYIRDTSWIKVKA